MAKQLSFRASGDTIERRAEDCYRPSIQLARSSVTGDRGTVYVPPRVSLRLILGVSLLLVSFLCLVLCFVPVSRECRLRVSGTCDARSGWCDVTALIPARVRANRDRSKALYFQRDHRGRYSSVVEASDGRLAFFGGAVQDGVRGTLIIPLRSSPLLGRRHDGSY